MHQPIQGLTPSKFYLCVGNYEGTINAFGQFELQSLWKHPKLVQPNSNKFKSIKMHTLILTKTNTMLMVFDIDTR
jgi:hypothetical protein